MTNDQCLLPAACCLLPLAQVMERLSKEWVPLFLDYVASKTAGADDDWEADPDPGAGAETQPEQQQQQQHDPAEAAAAVACDALTIPVKAGGVGVLSRVGGKAWRAQLVEWLNLLSGMKGARGLHRWEVLGVHMCGGGPAWRTTV